MKKWIALVFLLVLSSGVVLGANLDVQKVDKGSVILSELGNEAVFDFIITNNGESDNFEIYSLVGFSMTPIGTFKLESGETKRIEVTAKPSDFVRENNKGIIQFEYQIRGQSSGIFRDTLNVRIVPFENSLYVNAKELNPDDESARIDIQNVYNTRLEDLNLKLSSVFFEDERVISLEPLGNTTILVPLNKDFEGVVAGDYPVTIEISYRGLDRIIESSINYTEKAEIATQEETSGLIIRNMKVTKVNDGNIPVVASVNLDKNIITRLFTSTSPAPSVVDRSAWKVTYYWEKEVAPGESYSVNSTTNYTLPVVFAVLVVLITLFVRIYSTQSVLVDKRVSFVRTKEEKFALKVKISVKAKKHLDDVQIIDKLPNLVKLYEKFGRKPDQIDAKNRRLIWNLGDMNGGEERVVSYIIYSDLNVVGRFELPPASVVFNADGKTSEAWSNRSFFVSETAKEN